MRPEVYAAFVEHLGRMAEEPQEKLAAWMGIDPQSLTPQGADLLRRHAGEGPYDALDMTEAVMAEEEQTGKPISDEAMRAFYREPVGYEDRPGLFNKLRRTLHVGGKKPVYGPPQPLEWEGDTPKLPDKTAMSVSPEAQKLLVARYGPDGWDEGGAAEAQMYVDDPEASPRAKLKFGPPKAAEVEPAEDEDGSGTPPWMKALTLAGLTTGTGVGMLRARKLPGAQEKAVRIMKDLGVGTTLGWAPSVVHEGVQGVREM